MDNEHSDNGGFYYDKPTPPVYETPQRRKSDAECGSGAKIAEDTPLLAAKRTAFDRPTGFNLDALIAAAQASGTVRLSDGIDIFQAALDVRDAKAKHKELRKALIEAQDLVSRLGTAIGKSVYVVSEAEKRLIAAAQ